MSYFEDNYQNINLPTGIDGLRKAQLGALHAVASHFTLHDKEPALVVMPTGSGKTAVIVSVPFMLRAKRVLVLSSSVLVRGQIVEEFTNLFIVKRRKVVPEDLELPKVFEINSVISSREQWDSYEDYDVVIGIPNIVAGGLKEDFFDHTELFDLILVDEAHHSAAYTWKQVVAAFPKTKKVFFTATPFRRDKKEVEGRIVYNYPLSRAYEDKIFGEVEFHAVTDQTGNPDVDIAKKAERIFAEDRASGYDHYMMVRTNTKKHAKELKQLYESETSLNLRLISSDKTYTYIKQTIGKLRRRKLDGIICVDMLGEGFDFPNLKIAAVHVPHKSLAITMQFIGRFARTNADNIDKAKFIALPSDLEIGKKLLYEENAKWKDLIIDLSENRIRKEEELKEAIFSFENVTDDILENEELSLYNLNPYNHTKIFKVDSFYNDSIITVPNQSVLYHFISEELSTVVFITEDRQKPKWLNSDELVNIKYNLFIIFHDQGSGLLFIHSSIKTNEFYDSILEQFSNKETAKRISKEHIHKVLADLTDTSFFNIGMKNLYANSGESYRIMAGEKTEERIDKSDGRMYGNGHVFCKAQSATGSLTIGYSSGSKVWSNAYTQIPFFINWCKEIGQKIISDKVVSTNSGLDYLSLGKVISTFPTEVFAASWHTDILLQTPILTISDTQNQCTYNLLDFDVVLDSNKSNENKIELILVKDELNMALYEI